MFFIILYYICLYNICIVVWSFLFKRYVYITDKCVMFIHAYNDLFVHTVVFEHFNVVGAFNHRELDDFLQIHIN